ncbi:4-hydroxyphenylacetate decarboxylase glycyl radical subunit-like [Macrobrachium rosenbergii]|uniref:4-hydroxyphenylacetate decarboxylase glycyl radical subunit-like n=1 Tax=Macrobrachium rosenbergii TaxID=79674 RepID=UPI0034D3F6C9
MAKVGSCPYQKQSIKPEDGEDQPNSYTQLGLFDFRHNFGKFINMILSTKDRSTKTEIMKVVRRLKELAHSMHGRTRVLVAFDPELWNLWGCPVPLEKRPKSEYLTKNSKKFISTPGDVFFYIKSDVLKNANQLLCLLKEMLENNCKQCVEKISITESVEHGNTNIIGGLFREGIGNFSDPVSTNQHILINGTGKGMPGGTYMMTQKFEINWDVVGTKSKTQKEDMIGRRVMTQTIIPSNYERRHTNRAHHVNDFPPPCNILKGFRRVFRQSLPYGKSNSGHGREKGVFYLSITKSTTVFVELLEHLAGVQAFSPNGEITVDELISDLIPLEGTFWYVPNRQELEIDTPGVCKVDLDPHWDVTSKNGYMFYNQKYYMYAMTNGHYENNEAPTPRVLRLLGYAFEQWNHHWFRLQTAPEIPRLQELLKPDEEHFKDASIPIRKGLATKKSLGELFTTSDVTANPSKFYGFKADLFNIHPSELIVGRMPRFSLGLGKVVMNYLNDDERMSAFLMGLSEVSGVGHIIPQHDKLLKLGLDALLEDLKERKAKEGLSVEKQEFFESCIMAWEGMQMYMENYAKLAAHLSSLEKEYSKSELKNFKAISQRMQKLAHEPPETLLEAVQVIFTLHCCLHLIGEPVAVGRFDQFLEPYQNSCSIEEAQEIIDCFWIKLSERVLLNRHNVVDLTQWGNVAVPYASNGQFPNGDSINQWVQQLTIGGYKACNGEAKPASNRITMLCLKAARRLPLNAPCLSLRLHDGLSADLIVEAAKALLSGGAHPILPHDDRLIPGLMKAGSKLSVPMPLSDARDYGCDGCYEPMIAGKSEFAFTYIPLPQIIELTMNQGTLYAQSGPNFLKGQAASFTTPHPDNITTFEQFKQIFAKHLRIKLEGNLFGVIQNYGNIWKYCPTPLLSPVIDGCLETGRDLYNGGSKYHILSCMFVGFSTCIDSLYAIKKMCYEEATAVVSLSELLVCLKCDWGFQLQEPFVDDIAGPIRTKERKDQFGILRQHALSFEKFGTEVAADNKEIRELVAWLSDLIIETFDDVVYGQNEDRPFVKKLEELKERYTDPDSSAPFEFLFTPGSGTFEGYVGWGLSCGASADGRREGMPIASDFSPSPSSQDLAPNPPYSDVFKALQNWDHPSINEGFSCGAEIDLNVTEDFPLDELIRLIYKFSHQEGSIGGNLLTVTCADEKTYEQATMFPEKYGLLRVRMGGWTEFFTAMFDAHQEQHRRRPYFAA